MKVSQELLDLTNKFLEEFFVLAAKDNAKMYGEKKAKRDDLFHFNFTLADAIAQSNRPKYKEENISCLMSMASFDDSIAKAFLNDRIQGFISAVEKRIKKLKNQEDYIVFDVKKESFQKEVPDFNWDFEDGKMVNFTVGKKNIDAEKVNFKAKNTRSGFEGSAIIHREIKKRFINDNEFVEEMTTIEIDFFNKSGEKIMNVRFGYEEKEEATFTHYKHIADINSFYLILT